MKRIFLLTLVLSVIYCSLNAQWSGTSLDGNTYRNGNVGIGVPEPNYKLHVNGDISLSGYLRNKSITVKSTDVDNIFDHMDYDLIDLGAQAGSGNEITAIKLTSAVGQTTFGTRLMQEDKIFRIQCGSGKSNPYALFINGENGNIGIGTDSPSEKLTVSGGNLHISNAEESTISSSAHNLIFSGIPGGYAHRIYIFRPAWGSKGTTCSSLQLQKANTSGDYSTNVLFHTSGDSYLNGGNVGIGTTSPYYKLDVEGTIRAHEIKVNLNSGADFVFEEDYNLMPLNELETFVKTKKHLPEVAPAKEMEAEGLSISEMNIKLLQKIEELTLYTIEQEKRIVELENQNKRIEELEKAIKKLQ